MNINDFDFNLPSELIASVPLSERTASRLLCLDRKTGAIAHKTFVDILDLLKPNDLLVFNDTKVIPARLYGKKTSGGKIEVLIERILEDNRVLAQVRSNKTLKPGTELILENAVNATILKKEHEFFEIYFSGLKKEITVLQILEKYGHIPLPPYIKREANDFDKERYQTVFAKKEGAVAAPTAALHFDEKIIETIKKQGNKVAFITLHVGAGTYQPVRVSNILEHKMHFERVEITEETADLINATKKNGGRIIAIGTTTVRTLEAAASKTGKVEAINFDTDIFIYPGFKFKCVDAILTNFHLPKSTLLMLVSAFAGRENILRAYLEAIDLRYRFFSYGDAMFIS